MECPPLRPLRRPLVSCARVEEAVQKLEAAGLIEQRVRPDGVMGFHVTLLGRQALAAKQSLHWWEDAA